MPVMAIALDIQPLQAMPVSLICALSTAISASILNPIDSRTLKWVFLFAPLAIAGVLISTPLAFALRSRQLLFCFSAFIMLIIFIMRRAKKPLNEPMIIKPGSNKETLFGAIIAFFSGSSAGLFGIGGGIIMVPLLSSICRISVKETMQISLLTMIFTSVVGLMLHSSISQVSWQLGFSAMIGAIPAGFLGGRARKCLTENSLTRMFTVFAVLMAIATLIKALGIRA